MEDYRLPYRISPSPSAKAAVVEACCPARHPGQRGSAGRSGSYRNLASVNLVLRKKDLALIEVGYPDNVSAVSVSSVPES